MPTQRTNIRIQVTGGDQARQQFAQTGASFDRTAQRMQRGARQTSVALRAVDVASRQLRRTVTQFGAIGAGLFGAQALIRGIGNATAAIGTFERTMSGVRAVTKATDQDMQALTRVARDLGARTEASATQAAEGMAFLGRAGFETTEIIQSLPAVLDLSTAGALELAKAADIASNIMAGFGIAANEFRGAADVLALTAASANTNIEQLGEAMSFVAPVASALGRTLGETSAAIGVLSNAGIQASSAGTGLRRILSELAAPSTQARDVIAQLGLTLADLDPSTRSIVEIIDTLADANLRAAQAFTIFGDRGAPAILALISQREGLRDLTQRIDSAGGTTARMAKTMRDNLGVAVLELKSAAQELIFTLGDAGLTKILLNVTKGLTNAARAAAEFADGMTTVERVTKRLRDAPGSVVREEQFAVLKQAREDVDRLQKELEDLGPGLANIRIGSPEFLALPLATRAALADLRIELQSAIGQLVAFEQAMEKAAQAGQTIEEALALPPVDVTYDKATASTEALFTALKDIVDLQAFSKLRGEIDTLEQSLARADELGLLPEQIQLTRDRLQAAREELQKLRGVPDLDDVFKAASLPALTAQLKQLETRLKQAKLPGEFQQIASAIRDVKTEIEDLTQVLSIDQQIAFDALGELGNAFSESLEREGERAAEAFVNVQEKAAERSLQIIRDREAEQTRIAKDAQDARQRQAEQAAIDTQRILGDALFNAITERGDDAFESLIDGFLRTLARMAAIALSNEIVIPIVTQLTSAVGLPNPFAGTTGIIPGGSGAGALAQLGGGQGVFSNILGTQLLPGATEAATSGEALLFGASPQGGVPVSAGFSLGTLLSGVGVGVGGGFLLSNLLGSFGLSGPAQTGLAGAGGGAAAGAILAPLIGSIIPGVGPALSALIGGLFGGGLGTLFGGLFGGKQIPEAQIATLSSGSRQQFEDEIARRSPFGLVGLADLGSSDIDQELTQQLVNAVVAADEQIASFLSDRQQERVATALQTVEGVPFRGDIDDDAIVVLLRNRFQNIVNTLGAEFGAPTAGLSAFRGILPTAENFPLFEEALTNAVEVLQAFEALTNEIEADEMSQAARAIEALNEQFNDLTVQAQKLGLATDVLERAREDRLRQLTVDFETAIQDQILALTDPAELALRELERLQDQRLQEAKDLGANLVEVERLNALERAALLDQELQRSGRSISGSIQRFMAGLLGGPQSPLAPETVFANAQMGFTQAIQGGDESTIVEASRFLLDAAREMFASGPEFFSIFNDVLNRLQAFQSRVAVASAIPGFQLGGRVTIGGVGGADSQLFAARVSPGEQVRVSARPDQELQVLRAIGAQQAESTVLLRRSLAEQQQLCQEFIALRRRLDRVVASMQPGIGQGL